LRLRLDQLLVQRHLVETRERAHSLILAGAVLVDGAPATRPAQSVADDAAVELEHPGPEYVSRGALKLEKALDSWAIDPAGMVAVDIGASTGGFTDLLLRRGAMRVYAVDVGYGQLHYKLRSDVRVISMERTNARSLTQLPEPPDIAVVDVAFISLRLVLPPLFDLLKSQAPIVALVKPQFEAGRQHVHKGGVVRDPRVHRQVLVDLVDWSSTQPWCITDLLPSPIKGPAGNVEFLSRWTDARGQGSGIRGQEPMLETIQQALAEVAIMQRPLTPGP
jgi:23S rRNA (cytidine1920-2'-O)/16S rRNA (cytidine1409-2'-O)-methyltransferase